METDEEKPAFGECRPVNIFLGPGERELRNLHKPEFKQKSGALEAQTASTYQ